MVTPDVRNSTIGHISSPTDIWFKMGKEDFDLCLLPLDSIIRDIVGQTH